MEELDFIELFEKLWAMLPKESVAVELVKKHTVLTICYDSSGIWVCHQVSIGPRGGIVEQLVALKPDVYPVVDRLICHVSTRHPGLSPSFIQLDWDEENELEPKLYRLRLEQKVELFKRKLLETSVSHREASGETLESKLRYHDQLCDRSITPLAGCYGTSAKR